LRKLRKSGNASYWLRCANFYGIRRLRASSATAPRGSADLFTSFRNDSWRIRIP
jgi:hypothetical protein